MDETSHTAEGWPSMESSAAQEQTTWQNLFEAWSDLPDTMLDELDQLRHSNPPTPPLEQ